MSTPRKAGARSCGKTAGTNLGLRRADVRPVPASRRSRGPRGRGAKPTGFDSPPGPARFGARQSARPFARCSRVAPKICPDGRVFDQSIAISRFSVLRLDYGLGSSSAMIAAWERDLNVNIFGPKCGDFLAHCGSVISSIAANSAKRVRISLTPGAPVFEHWSFVIPLRELEQTTVFHAAI